MQTRQSLRVLALAGLMGLTPAAFGDERIVVVPGAGIHTESDQERTYAIPGGGFYVETLAAAAERRRVMLWVGP